MLETVEPRLLLSTFTVTSTDDSDTGTLRQAIVDSNASPGANIIHFNIPGTGLHVIRPTSALPSIQNTVVIDGYSQPGSAPNTALQRDNATLTIVLDGSGIADRTRRTGLQIKADNSLVRGLAIDNFDAVGVLFVGSGDHLEGSFIGVDPSGKVAQPNGLGVGVFGGGDVIGGTAPAARNVISGNTAGVGIANLTLGGKSLVGPAAGGFIQNNLIGTYADGVGDLGNATVGVAIIGSGNVVGGTNPGEANTIAFNGKAGAVLNLGAGIVVAGLAPTTGAPAALVSTGDLISGNSIYSNQSLGIAQVTVPTSALLPLLNFSSANLTSVVSNVLLNLQPGVSANVHLPNLTSAITTNGVTTVLGALSGAPNTAFRIQFFAGQGRTFLGQTTITTGAGGTAPITFTTPPSVSVGQAITATSIDPANNTSEFSNGVTVTQPPIVSVGPDTSVQVGDTLARTGSISNAGAQTLTATVDYGDGSGPIPLALNADRTFALSHAYQAAGTYRVSVSVVGGGATGSASFQTVVVARPAQVTSPIEVTLTKKLITKFVVHFNAAVSGAGNPANFHLALVTTRRVKGKLVIVTKTVPSSVTYDGSSQTTTIVPFGKLSPRKVNQLTITAAGILDSLGRALDGNHDGLAGGDLVSTIANGTVTILGGPAKR